MAEWRKNNKYKTASNEHIAKIAALPRVDNFCVFLQPLHALRKCWEAATSAICHYVKCKFLEKGTLIARKTII
jgi:hypothetical protein